MILRTITRHPLWTLLSLAFSLLILSSLFILILVVQLPSVTTLKDVHLQVPLRIYSADKQLIAEFGTKRRQPITIDKVPPLQIRALLDTEDARFYEHSGIDPIGIARAALAVISSGRKVQGASTITMQVARNFFLSRKKTYTRKIKEILLAFKIEHHFSKNDILELYLNKVYFGNRAYGIATAAHVYYGKNLDQLSLAEMAMLAGLPQAPSRDNPLNNPAGALKRRNHVLARMLSLQHISKQAYQQAINAPITASYHETKIAVYAPYIAEMVRQALIKRFGQDAYQNGYTVITTIIPKKQREAQQALQDGIMAYSQRHGYRGPEKHWDLTQMSTNQQIDALDAMTVINQLEPAVVTAVNNKQVNILNEEGNTATIDWAGLSWARPQKSNGRAGAKPQDAHAILQVGDVIRVIQKGNQWMLSQIPEVEGAIIGLNPNSGAIESLSGGFSYQKSRFNRVTQAKRQPGSIIKPFIYSAALNKGYTLATMLNDAPIVMNDSGENALWRPNNDNYTFHGPTSLLNGLTQSRNLISIRLLQEIGIPYAIAYLEKFGFKKEDLPSSLSLALGTAQTSVLSLSQAYAIFANGGFDVKPYLIDQVYDAKNKLVYQENRPTACYHCAIAQHDQINKDSLAIDAPAQTSAINQDTHAPSIISPQNAYLMTLAMKNVIQKGTGRAAKQLKRSDLCGKTGTTSDQTDAWFAGFNHQELSIVWLGFDDPKHSLHEYGSQAALPIWMQYMNSSLKGTPSSMIEQPWGIVSTKIDPQTGLLANAGQSNAIFETFRSDHAPTEYAPLTSSTTTKAPIHSNAQHHPPSKEPSPLF